MVMPTLRTIQPRYFCGFHYGFISATIITAIALIMALLIKSPKLKNLILNKSYEFSGFSLK
jgi:hypothetical protein